MSRRRTIHLYSAYAWLAASCVALASHPATAQSVPQAHAGWLGETGLASWYGRLQQGRRTASGRRFDAHALTAAHPWLPFGTLVRVTLSGTGRSVVVVITDRLASTHRIIDLSRAAAIKLGMLGEGLARVSLSPI